MKSKVNYIAIFTFFTVAVFLRFLTNKTALLDNLNNDFLQIILQGVGPAIGALVVFIVFKKKPVLSLKGNYQNLLSPTLLYWGLPMILIWIVDYFTDENFSLAGVFFILIYGLLEEIGWRGFLQQELKPLPKFLNILIVAVLWFIWHLNFDFTSSNLLFFFILLFGSWGIGLVADKTYSLIAVSAFHSLNNFFPELNSRTTIILIGLIAVWIVSLILRKYLSNRNLGQIKR